MNVVICGSRGFNDYEKLKAIMDNSISPITKIINGGAKGADALGERYAQERGIPLEVYEPNWTLHGKKAGILRNIVMADLADYVVAFWDGKSRGTLQMIQYCDRQDIPHFIAMTKEKENETH